MSSMYHYKGYEGTIAYSLEDRCFYGKIAFIRDLILYESDTIENLEKEFRDAVDDYLETCKEEGKTPDKPFKGSFNVRPGPDLHRRAFIYAQQHDMNLNAVVKQALESYLSGR